MSYVVNLSGGCLIPALYAKYAGCEFEISVRTCSDLRVPIHRLPCSHTPAPFDRTMTISPLRHRSSCAAAAAALADACVAATADHPRSYQLWAAAAAACPRWQSRVQTLQRGLVAISRDRPPGADTFVFVSCFLPSLSSGFHLNKPRSAASLLFRRANVLFCVPVPCFPLLTFLPLFRCNYGRLPWLCNTLPRILDSND